MALSNSKTTKTKRKQVSANAAWLKEQRGELAEMKADYKAFLTKHPEFKPAKKANKTVKTTGKIVCENDKFKSCTATIYSNPANPDRQKIVLTSYKKTGRGGINAAIKRNVKKAGVKKEADGYYGAYYIVKGKKVNYTEKQKILISNWNLALFGVGGGIVAGKEINGEKMLKETIQIGNKLKHTGLVEHIVSGNIMHGSKTISSEYGLGVVWVYPADKSKAIEQNKSLYNSKKVKDFTTRYAEFLPISKW